jgi:hypothetical protein
VSLAHIAVQSDVLASDASARIRRRPADDGAPEPASSTESIIEYVLASDAAMAARAQRRACGSLPSFGETRRGIRRHGDARLGAAKRVERDAKLRQQHRRLRHAHRIVDDERFVDVPQNTMDAQFASVSARASTATTARAANRRHRLAIRIALTLVNNGGQQRGHTSLRLLVVSSILDCSTISEVLDRRDQLPLGPHANRVLVHRLVDDRERHKRGQFEILQADADLGGALSDEADVRRGGENIVNAARALVCTVVGVLKRQPGDRRQLVSAKLEARPSQKRDRTPPGGAQRGA